ncbi:MAG TPA: hypothetical protein VEQ59_02295 [Polyangiaceae bacterium]|nr:hypothetical protein [Polyangiaceae bacterium]
MFAGCLLLWSATADAHVRIRTYTGGFTSSQIECDTMCTGGPLTGGLAGTLAWTMESMEQTSDPNVVKLIGVDTVTTAAGTLSGPDYTLWNLATGDFVDVALINSGTGAFAGAHGTLVIQGAFDSAAGHGTSNYVSVITLPH